MAWYKTGTVSVTNGSATVTGVGTDFIANAQVSEEFRLSGGQRGYEITAINSKTSLTISPAYMDSTQSGASYVIVPTRGFANEARDALRAILATLDDYLDGPLSGLFGSGTVGAPGLASKTDTNTGLYWPGADQIAAAVNGIRRLLLSATALQVDVPITGTAVQSDVLDTTPGRLLTVGAGGWLTNGNIPGIGNVDSLTLGNGLFSFASGVTNFSSLPSVLQGNGALLHMRRDASNFVEIAWRNSGTPGIWRRHNVGGTLGAFWQMYDQQTAVGTVSFSGSDVNGALIEAGSNSNGSYVRFADGTQLCWHTLNLGSITANGSGTRDDPYRTNTVIAATWVYPASFASTPVVAASPRVSSTAVIDRASSITLGNNSASNSQISGIYVIRATSNNNADTAYAYLQAIGRWA